MVWDKILFMLCFEVDLSLSYVFKVYFRVQLVFPIVCLNFTTIVIPFSLLKQIILILFE